ncbi:hypothetical protein BJY01DRAFT_230216 [Aspergillus pseudoustus]|uniref:Translational machinery component n=1 Tax=Aspergillus pseudoustus TaxID=1810923 RepID=A0ABR4ICA5_9EURO
MFPDPLPRLLPQAYLLLQFTFKSPPGALFHSYKRSANCLGAAESSFHTPPGIARPAPLPFRPLLFSPASQFKMNNTFASALARALPSVGRQCQQPRASFFRQTRALSTTPLLRAGRIESQEIEQQLLGGNTSAPPGVNATEPTLQSLLSSSNQAVSREYTQMVNDIEAKIKPYVDQVPAHHIHVYAHKHNTILTLTRPNGSPLLSMSCGHLGFRKGKRAGYDPAFQLCSHVFAQIQERGLLMDIQNLEIIYRGFHQGREAFNKILLGNEGKNIRGLVSKVSDSTRLKFGGTRSSRPRRLG